MPLYRWMEQSRDALVAELQEIQQRIDAIAPGRDFILAEHAKVTRVLDDLIAVLVPGYRGFGCATDPAMPIADQVNQVAPELRILVRKALEHKHATNAGPAPDFEAASTTVAIHVLEGLPGVKSALVEDIQAAYDGDPAAVSVMEVILSYPCILAILTYRIANLLYRHGVPLIPRVMTELAHSRTGIDIHPGATIGPGFFIDHGTGVVIGETCVIGRNVKLYQGVTLGALSFPRDTQGRILRGHKRHPNVEDHVTIYSGATILGGDTTIGAHAEIGGNVWLTHSVPPYSRVYNQQPNPLVKPGAQTQPADADRGA